jgi:peroxiredoxin
MLCRVLAALTITLAALNSTVLAGQFNEVLKIGDTAPAWSELPGVDGKKHSLADLKAKDAVVVIITCNSCEYAIDYEDRTIAFEKKYGGPDGKVAVVAINVNDRPQDSFEKMKERAESKGFRHPYLFDASQKIAKQYGAIFTPEYYVLDKDRKIVYMGKMDDSDKPDNVKVKFVELAVEAALKGQLPEVKETAPVGCMVKYKRERK